MKYLAQAQALLKQQPLPDDAPQQLSNLEQQASGQERAFIQQCYEALYTAATEQQLTAWQEAD